ncbi:MAG: HrpE/YscL family type III secretion apparatus protein [Desulfovibrionaceae bacterium]|nr:HrpE/YscL family type III secretion apparatus protein [Desulfovibrionaceae bacterium]
MGGFVRITKDSFDLAPGTKVLRAEEYGELVQAGEIVEMARAQARRIQEEARRVYEAERTRGYEDGLDKGRMEIAERMMDTVGQTVDYLGSVEESVTDVVIQALRKIVGEMDDRERIVRVVRNALAVVRNQNRVTARVSPKDAERVKGAVDEILSGYPGIAFLDVSADSRLSPGGCILESEIGVVEASVDIQIEAIRKSLLKRIKRAE